MTSAPTPIEVRAWDHLVGHVSADASTRFSAFEYDPDWIKEGIELAPLTMPTAEPRFSFPDLPEDTFHGLPSLIADSLPDDFGNTLIDAWYAERGVAPSEVTPMDRLRYLGTATMGALEFEPAAREPADSDVPIDLQVLVTGARAMLEGRFTGDPGSEAAIRTLGVVGTAAGGARAKAVIAWNRSSGEYRSGTCGPIAGFEPWLIKLDGVGRDSELGAGGAYGRVEFAYYRMATSAGIAMAECALILEGERAHFATRRFDRPDSGARLHTLSLGAMSHLDFRARGTNAYDRYFETIVALGLGPGALDQAFRRMVLNVLARNCDDHTKNFSFLLDPETGWSLSPAYDVTFAYNPNGEWTYQHLMSVNGRFDDIRMEDLLAVAQQFGIPAADGVLDEVGQAVSRWEEFGAEAGLSDTQVRGIGSTFPRLDRT